MELDYQTQQTLSNPRQPVARALLAFILGGIACGVTSVVQLCQLHGGQFAASPNRNLIVAGLLIALVALVFIPGYLVARGEALRIERCRRAICECGFLARWRNGAASIGRETFITHLGVFANGRWTIWGTSKLTLKNVRITPSTFGRPAMIEFTINDGRRDTVEHVLIPAGEEILAGKIARLLATSKTLAPVATPQRGQVGQLRFS